MDRDLVWFEMPVGVQISNIGSEVNRAIRYKNKGDKQKTINFCDKAIEFFEIIKRDPKNSRRIGEFNCCIDELVDYFKGDNSFNTNDEMLHSYYDAFI